MKIIHHTRYLLLAAIILLTSCKNSANDLTQRGKDQTLVSADSIALTQLVRKAYAWRETDFRRNGFPFKLPTPGDSIFIGMDWDSYYKDINVYQATSFFAKDFFDTHLAIARTLDSSIKLASIEWRKTNDGVSIWDVENDDWCSCQDYPDGYWEAMTLYHFRYSKDDVTFNWTWGNADGMQPNTYTMKAKLENGNWKISYLEGFSSYKSFAQYQQIMTMHLE